MSHQAIFTKFVGPTNHRGARIKVSCDAKTITVPWNYEKDVDFNHIDARNALVEQLGWSGKWEMGSAPAKSKVGFVHVCVRRY